MCAEESAKEEYYGPVCPTRFLTPCQSQSSGPAVDSFQSLSPTLNQRGAGQGGDTG
jgi:hypothetical protein